MNRPYLILCTTKHTCMITKIAEVLLHPDELTPLYKLIRQYREFKPDKRTVGELAKSLSHEEFCYATLTKVSRSFAVVIQQLPEELKEPVCIFYLVLRALDSIEDDTSTDPELRKKLLSEFYINLDNEHWNLSNVGDKADYRLLLENFEKVIHQYQKLDEKYRRVISEITRQMGQGMTEYLDEEIIRTEDYDQYCYYVAGLVGIGLTNLFVLSGLQDASLKNDTRRSISMGLFLQKTNIIRDYLEDLQEQRTFWPREIWGQYSADLHSFIADTSERRIHCLNHMIVDALAHVPDCLNYMNQIENTKVLNF